MWKSGTARKILPAALASRRWLGWSGASLLAALLAGLLGFLSTSPALAGASKMFALLLVMSCAVFFAIDRSSQKRTR